MLGTGMVGSAIATRLLEVGHDVRMGARAAGNEAAVTWADAGGDGASQGSFAEAAAFADELVFNATNGNHAVEVADSAAAELEGKVLVDVTNPLEPTDDGMALSVGVTDSLAESIQRTLPQTWVVKALNTMNCEVMVRPDIVPGDHAAFLCGDDEAAKAKTVALLREFGWPAERVIDLGDIAAARGMEAYVLIWVRMMGALGGSRFNVEVRRG